MLLTVLFGPLDDATIRSSETQVEWVEVARGEYLLPADKASNDLYIVVSGYLEVLLPLKPGGPAQVLDHVARGEYIGETTIFTGEPWNTVIRAVRDSVLAKFDASVFAEFCQRHPQAMQTVARMAFERVKRQQTGSGRLRPSVKAGGNIAILALESGVRDFARRLSRALKENLAVFHVASPDVERLFPMLSGLPHDDPRQIRLSTWLDQQELEQHLVLYEADAGLTDWTRRCIQRADQLLLVANAQSDPLPGELERACAAWENPVHPAAKSLILLHPDGRNLPSQTERWLRGRSVQNVYHVRGDSEADTDRLARILSGHAVGLALGAGGARGIAHVGVIRALDEAGIPIDIVGGTSVGSIVAAMVAMGMKWDAMMDAFRVFARMKPHQDYTFPLSGLVRGRKFDRVMQRIFQDGCLEDLWLNCFGISTNLSTAQMVIHERGPVCKMVRASCALPAIVVPAVDRGELFIDGGVINSLPGDILRERCGTVIAVDVSAHSRLTVEAERVGLPSAWQVLYSRLHPFRQSLSVPSIVEIIEQTMALASFERKARVADDADLYLCPPVGHFPSIDVTSFEAIQQAGYSYAQKEIDAWQKRTASEQKPNVRVKRTAQ